MHFQVRVGVFNCQRILAKISFVIFDIVIKKNKSNVKFHWFGINWLVFKQSECRNCCLYVVIQKIALKAKSGKYFHIWFFPRFGGKKWRRSEYAHASYPGLFFRPPGLSPYIGREGRRVQGLDYVCTDWSVTAGTQMTRRGILLFTFSHLSVVFYITIAKNENLINIAINRTENKVD